MKPDLEQMAHMWNVDGLAMSDIASRMRTTRHAIAGIIHRNRDKFESRRNADGMKPIEKRKTKPRNQPQNANKRRKAFHTVKVSEMATIAPPNLPEPEIDGREYDAARLPFAKDLMSISDCECKWWVSDGPLMFFAEEVVPGKSWCAHHAKRAVGSGTISERNAARDARKAA